jgi:hypothetical protein
MRVEISIANEYGWALGHYWVLDGSDTECYALHKSADRVAFWANKTGVPLRSGRAMIWRVTPPVAASAWSTGSVP